MTELVLFIGFIGFAALCWIEACCPEILETSSEEPEEEIPLWLAHVSGPYVGKNHIKLKGDD